LQDEIAFAVKESKNMPILTRR